MKEVVITAGVYGRRDERGRVLPVTKGERVTLPDEEAARLVALEVAVYADVPTLDTDTVSRGEIAGDALRNVISKLQEGGASSPDDIPETTHEIAQEGEEPETSKDTTDVEPPAETAAGGEGGNATNIEVSRLERMQRPDLEQMAADLGIDAVSIVNAKNKHDLAVLIVAADGTEDGEVPPELDAGDIVQ